MSALQRIEIKGYKSIQDLSNFRLNNLNVLIGANGAGKTNFITLFKLLNKIVENNLQTYTAQSGGANTFLHFGRKTTSEISIKLWFGQNGYGANLSPTTDDALIFSHESCWYSSGQYSKPFEVSLGNGHKETGLHSEVRNNPGKVASYVLKALTSWKVYHFHDTSDAAQVKQTTDIGDNWVLKPNASNLAAFLYLLRTAHPTSYQLIVDTIRMVAPFFDDFSLRPSPFNSDKIQLEWRERGSDTYFNAHGFSDGTLRFICLAVLLLQPNLPSTVLIDEPELGLHPYAITLLASMLQSAAAKTQVIVSTQSVPLVNQFSPEDVIVVDREENQSVFRRLSTLEMTSWLDEYGLGDLWEKNVIGGRPQR